MSQELNMENMTQAEIIAQMKTLMKVLEKKEKAQTKTLEKMEEKKEKAAPVKGVRPAQLDKNAKWVEYVHEYMLTNGWEAFTHAERYGKGMADVEYPASERVAIEDGEAHVFEGSVEPTSPMGVQPNLSHAMTLSKLYKVTKPELYSAFEEEYEPVESVPALSKAKARVTLTMEEKLQQKVEKELAKEREKEEKKAERERVRAEKKAEKEEEKRLEKLAKEMAKAKLPKGAAKAVVPKVVKTVVPKVVARPVMAAAASAASSSVTPAAPVKIVKSVKPATPAWVKPEKGKWVRVTVGGISYFVDHLNRAFSPTEEGTAGECAGVYLPEHHVISELNVPEDDDYEEASMMD